VLTTDNDVLIYGAECVARWYVFSPMFWSLLRFSNPAVGNSPDHPQHFDNIEIYNACLVAGCLGLTRAECILIALLSGGDYHVGIFVLGVKDTSGDANLNDCQNKGWHSWLQHHDHIWTGQV
jgi:hypothetical protein